MLIIALIFAVLFYITLYVVYVALSPHVHPSSTVFTVLRDLLFSLPTLTPLAILKWAIIIMAFYLIADTLLASTRWKRKTD